LTVCLSGRLENLPYGGLSSAVCGLHSFIRSPFVDGLHPRQAGKPALLPSAVRGLYSFIRSPFVDGLPLRLENLPYGGPPSAVCGPSSIVHSATLQKFYLI